MATRWEQEGPSSGPAVTGFFGRGFKVDGVLFAGGVFLTPRSAEPWDAPAIAALTPEGHKRVDQLLEQLAEAAGGREWLVRFAKTREVEADSGNTIGSAETEPGSMLTRQELDGLTVGFMRIRDQEPLDDVADWANAVLVLLEDETPR